MCFLTVNHPRIAAFPFSSPDSFFHYGKNFLTLSEYSIQARTEKEGENGGLGEELYSRMEIRKMAREEGLFLEPQGFMESEGEGRVGSDFLAGIYFVVDLN